jgi:hypothetical protein
MLLFTRYITFYQLLDRKYGERGAIERETWEKAFEIFKFEALNEQKQENKRLRENIFSNKNTL